MASRAFSWWFTAAEIAELGLPCLPDCARRIRNWAASEGWARRTTKDGAPLARPRKARGRSLEYHASLLPVPAQEMLSARRNRSAQAPIAANETSQADLNAWAWYDRQSTATKVKAGQLLAILVEVEARATAGVSKTASMQASAREHGVSPRAIANWFALVAGVPRTDWLPRLAPQYRGGGKEIEVDPGAWKLLRSNYCRLESPAFATCYNQVLEDYARPRGITLPCARTLKRKLDREESQLVTTSRRQGKEALRRMVPPQLRSVAELHAMQAVNIDGHTFDVFVEWEDGEIRRPVMVGIQDLYSRKILAHRIGKTESTRLARLTFADLFGDWGIPEVAVLDNSRAFASKALTGGAKTRFRFMIKEYEATGVLTSLGVKTHWTRPYRGSSKPIERAWRNLCCDDIAKHADVAGAYTGNKPDAKPENYRDRAIPIAEFRAHVARRLAAHNARAARRTEMARGGSFDDAFRASYEANVIGRANDVHMRIALLEAQERLCHRQHGSVNLFGNRYWSFDLLELRGQRVIVRFDPENLHSDVHVYSKDGRYLCAARAQEKTGFFDQEGAKRRAKDEAQLRRMEKEYREKADLLSAADVASLLSGHAEPPPRPVPGATRIVRHRGQTAAALKPIEQAVSEPAAPAFIDEVLDGFARLRAVE